MAPPSPLGSSTLFDMPQDCKANRAIALNVNSSHYIRITRRLKKVNSYYGLVRAFDSPAEAMGDEYQKVFGERACCDCPYFIRRWKNKFYKGRHGAVHVGRRNRLKKAVLWTANRPMVVSIVRCETASARMVDHWTSTFVPRPSLEKLPFISRILSHMPHAEGEVILIQAEASESVGSSASLG